MPSFYSGLATTSRRLLKSKGVSLSLTRDSGTFDPVLGSESSVTTTTITGYGVVTQYSNNETDGTNVKKGDLKLIFEATSTIPDVGDECTVDSVVYRVMNVSPVIPGGTLVISKIQLRK